MPTYLVLWNWTEQGLRNFRESPKRVEAFKQLAEKHGGKVVQFLYTMGKYDGAAIVEAPSDEAFLKMAVSLGSLGNVRTTTLKAWPASEASKVFNQL
ncbi:MAG TPA: GYD domain-containing protein [archaeon]|nr:GYD domain-containing protein [archaeon]